MIGDAGLAAEVRRIETGLAEGRTTAEDARRLLLEAVEVRYVPA